ncbi:MAG: PIN domain-containing protein [Dokdonella sp.]|uniref:PIN domain-containing protein n=1 Tax=Dokdonella sp. TaxID=2291710 RepID=UPI0025C5F573|nr:PIN domain-containing protein [Dokdonella sp.]MBX3700804.1 PIN domain-containing protein [Dokdonella sp.]MCW5577368.1 PIN domain-containing protein [Dokdonella sp.]
MTAKVFFDSNTLLYLATDDAEKAQRAETLLREGGTISVQVLNEMSLACRRKFRMAWDEVDEFLSPVRARCPVRVIDEETYDLGRRLAERHQFQVYDAMIVAAALLAGCDTLYSEVMHDGLRVGHDLTIRNPFRQE